MAKLCILYSNNFYVHVHLYVTMQYIDTRNYELCILYIEI